MANDIVAVMEKGENADLVKDQFAGMFVEAHSMEKFTPNKLVWYVQTAEYLWFLGGNMTL